MPALTRFVLRHKALVALFWVVVAAVGENSTAAEVGVQKGDVVVAVNGRKIATTRDLEKACAERARWWDLVIRRGGETIQTRLGG